MRPSVAIAITLTVAGFAAQSAHAQVVYVAFKDEKLAKPYSDYVTTLRGEACVIGEPKEGFTIKGETLNYTGGGEAKNVLWVGDPAKPQNVPYEKKGDVKSGAPGGKTVSIPGESILRVGFIDQYLTLEGIAQEFSNRTGEAKEFRAERDGFKKGDREWFAAHGRMIATLDGLASWLAQMGFGAASKRVKAESDREKKTVAKEASAIREKAALSSIRKIDTPERLTEVAQSAIGPKAKYHGRESMHARIFYPPDLLDDSQAEHALQLVEQLIEGFRKQFVIPYEDDEFPDYIPDQVIVEFFFTPDDKAAYDRFYTGYYGRSWEGEHKEDMLNSSGTKVPIGEKLYLGYNKKIKELDVDGTVAHQLGHFLANIHFKGGSRSESHDWLGEAVAYYLSFEYLGRNTLTCFTWGKAEYAKPQEKEGVKTVQLGQKGTFNEIAVAVGPPFDQLAIRQLHQFTDADLAKAWSFFDWIAKTQGRKGQIWLRTICFATMKGKTGFLERERPTAESLFDVEKGKDVYGVLDERWKKFAQTQQMK